MKTNRLKGGALLPLILWLAACATSYDPDAKEGWGYRSVSRNPEVHHLEFRANSFTSFKTVERYWYWRADEICAPEGRLAEELLQDGPSLVPRPRVVQPKPESSYQRLMAYWGDPLDSGYVHSKAGYFHCVLPPEDKKP
jgi:hypothetical protein